LKSRILILNPYCLQASSDKGFLLHAQCHRCQGYGHTKKYWFLHFISRECGENHSTSEFTHKQDDARSCHHCGKPHVANFKGCIKYLKEASTRKHHLKTNEPTSAAPTNGHPTLRVGKQSFVTIVRNNQPAVQPIHPLPLLPLM